MTGFPISLLQPLLQNERLPAGIIVELLAQAAARTAPDRTLIALRDLELEDAPVSSEDVAFVSTRGQPGDLEATLLAGAKDATRPLARAVLDLQHRYPPPPTKAAEAFALRDEARRCDARTLYESESENPVVAAESLRVVQWVRLAGMGRLVGEVSSRAPAFDLSEGEHPRSAPAALEGMLQLAKWLWYAFSGEGARAVSVRELRFYRLPRVAEPLHVEARLRGNSRGLPSLDVSAWDLAGVPMLKMKELRLRSRSLVPEGTSVPRLAWQAFGRSRT